MAKVPTPKAIKKGDFGLGKQATSAKGPFGGGTKYNQMKATTDFELSPIKGPNQKKPNLTPVIKNK